MAVRVFPQKTAVNGKVAIIRSMYNSKVTDALLKGALKTLSESGVDEKQIIILEVSGAFELSVAAMQAAREKLTALVIALGAVIRGETPHFDFICDAVAHGLTRAGQETGKPVSFGVITANTPEQAFERAGGNVGNKGSEAASAALELYSVLTQLEKQT